MYAPNLPRIMASLWSRHGAGMASAWDQHGVKMASARPRHGVSHSRPAMAEDYGFPVVRRGPVCLASLRGTRARARGGYFSHE